MSKNKSNKKTIPVRKFNVFFRVLALVLIALGVVALIIFVKPLLKQEELTPQVLFSKCYDAANKYNYARLVITRQESVDGDSYTAEYVVSADQSSSYRTYMFRDSDNNDLYQAWLKEDGASLYDVYIYASDPGSWVRTSLEYEPITTNMWDMFQYADGYAVMQDTYKWYDSDDECYVLQLVGDTDEWNFTYEEVFIRASDYLPMGVVLVVSTETDTDGHDIIMEGVNEDGDTVDATVSLSGNKTILQKYSITYSDEDQRLFDVPDTYITDEEYLSFLHKYSGEE